MGWLSETGRVVAVEPDAVWIEADRSAACGKCAARAGCGQGALSALLQNGKGRVSSPRAGNGNPAFILLKLYLGCRILMPLVEREAREEVFG